jgi:predicted RNA-binding Zn-ribbon protein involved in translation (DUF1610 family)
VPVDESAVSGTAEVHWPPRVTKERLRRLYASEAAGLLDEELLDEVGITLYLRCRAILDVDSALHSGMVRCPRCDRERRETMVAREQASRRNPDPPIVCPACGWATTWNAYETTFRRRQLNPGGATDYFRAFVDTYPRCATPRERMLAIDRLIHEFHYSLRTDPAMPTRPAAVNLIEGRLTDIVPFLDALSEGIVTAEMVSTRRAWETTMDRWASQYATWAEWRRASTADRGEERAVE